MGLDPGSLSLCLFSFALLLWLNGVSQDAAATSNERAFDRRCSMRPITLHRRLTAASLVALLFPVLALSQASPSIQFFMPNGTYPPREIRFEMAIDNGRIETFFSDSKGKFLLTRLLGLKPDAQYRITVIGDGAQLRYHDVFFQRVW